MTENLAESSASMRRAAPIGCSITQLPDYKITEFPMIFGFNTDVKHGDTIYHVQSEARESEQLLQTQVFVRGRCIGKKATSYAASGPAGRIQRSRRRSRCCATSIARCSTPSGKGSWRACLDRAEARDAGRHQRTGCAMAQRRLGSRRPQPHHAAARDRRRSRAPGARLTFASPAPMPRPSTPRPWPIPAAAPRSRSRSKSPRCPTRPCWCRPATKGAPPPASSRCAKRNEPERFWRSEKGILTAFLGCQLDRLVWGLLAVRWRWCRFIRRIGLSQRPLEVRARGCSRGLQGVH